MAQSIKISDDEMMLLREEADILPNMTNPGELNAEEQKVFFEIFSEPM